MGIDSDKSLDGTHGRVAADNALAVLIDVPSDFHSDHLAF